MLEGYSRTDVFGQLRGPGGCCSVGAIDTGGGCVCHRGMPLSRSSEHGRWLRRGATGCG